MMLRFVLLSLLLVLVLATIASSHRLPSAGIERTNGVRGAVYAMSNDLEKNTIVGYARNATDDFIFLGEFDTGGRGATLDNSTDGIDPLLSQNSVVVTPSKKFLLNVNAGSNTITAFKILPDLKLKRTSMARVTGTGPSAIAVNNEGLVYVASADFDGVFDSFSDSLGSLSGFRLTSTGILVPLEGSVRRLPTRPGDVVFSPDDMSLVASSFNAFFGALPAPSDSLLSFRVFPTGLLSDTPVDTASSTSPGNPPGRVPPAVIGIAIVEVGGVQYIVFPEIRAAQAGSISSFSLDSRSMLTSVQIDLVIGRSITNGQLAPCWIVFNSAKTIFYTSNTDSDTVSSFRFSSGQSTLLSEVAASGVSSLDGAIDMAISPDDKFLFVHGGANGEIGVFRISENGALEFVKNLKALPTGNTQGIVAI